MTMSDRGVVTINGQKYDAVSGLPVPKNHPSSTASTPHTPKPTVHADIKPVTKHTVERTVQSTNPHTKIQRSTTLNRKFTKKPIPTTQTIARHHPTRATRQDIRPITRTERPVTLSPTVRKFAPHPVGATQPNAETSEPEIQAPVTLHPHVAKAHVISQAKQAHRESAQASKHVPAAQIKQHSIAKAISDAATPTGKQHKARFWQQKQRVTGVIAATFAIVLLGGYFTYLNMPNLSVRVAAAQAGIDASYPNYRPDGYALNGPVTFSDGRVSMNFKSNGGNSSYTVNQSKSSWNSDAVLDNFVAPKAGDSYMPYTERGLTIFTFGNNAAWVNGGILYTIEGDAPLSSDQIRQIATSLL